jgi:hypothetical protein
MLCLLPSGIRKPVLGIDSWGLHNNALVSTALSLAGPTIAGQTVINNDALVPIIAIVLVAYQHRLVQFTKRIDYALCWVLILEGVYRCWVPGRQLR